MKQIEQHFAESHNIDKDDKGTRYQGCFKTHEEAKAFLVKHVKNRAQGFTLTRMGCSPYGEWRDSFNVDAYFAGMVDMGGA